MRIPMRQYMALLGITIAAFIFNTSEFIPIALLIDISKSFSMTEAATGQMITIYAWVVALLSLPLMLLTCRMELKRLLLMMVALFGLGQLVSGLATHRPSRRRSTRASSTSPTSATSARRLPPSLPCSAATST